MNDLVQRAYKAIREGVPANVLGIASDLKRLGKSKEAIELMRSAVESAQEQNIKFFLERQLITDFLSTDDLETGREFETLRGLAVAQPNLILGYYQTLQKLAGSGVNHAKESLESDWAAGAPLAGEVMVQSLLVNRDEVRAEQTLRKLVGLPLLPEGVLARLQSELIGLNEYRLAVVVIDEQIRRNKDDLRLRFALCSQLWAMGEHEMARREMRKLVHRGALQPDALFQIASFCLSLKEPGLAREWLEAAIRPTRISVTLSSV